MILRRLSAAGFSRQPYTYWLNARWLVVAFLFWAVCKPASAQDTSIQFASLKPLSVDSTALSLFSIESSYAKDQRGGALCLAVSRRNAPEQPSSETFCFYFEQGQTPLRDDSEGYTAVRLPGQGYQGAFRTWLENTGINSPPESVNLIASSLANAGSSEVISLKDILHDEVEIDSISFDLRTVGSEPEPSDFKSFDGIMQAAHILGVVTPLIIDAQRLSVNNQSLGASADKTASELNDAQHDTANMAFLENQVLIRLALFLAGIIVGVLGSYAFWMWWQQNRQRTPRNELELTQEPELIQDKPELKRHLEEELKSINALHGTYGEATLHQCLKKVLGELKRLVNEIRDEHESSLPALGRLDHV